MRGGFLSSFSVPGAGMLTRVDPNCPAGHGDGKGVVGVACALPQNKPAWNSWSGVSPLAVRSTGPPSETGTAPCPAGQFGSTLVSIPAPGTENDDKNPPRIAPRHLFDIAVGDDNLFHGEKYKWSLRLTAVNITNKVALYNFLSTFTGTHYVTPRSYTAELGFHF